MGDSADFERVAADDPERCQTMTGGGQCQFRRVSGAEQCEIHLGGGGKLKLRDKMTSMYNVARWRNRIDKFAGHDQVKGLREEIGIMRMLLETTLNLCQSDMDILLYSSKIGDLVTRIESLVRSCHKLESAMGMLLDRQAALQLSGETVEIISRHIHDEDTVKKIAEEMLEALVRIEAAGNVAQS